MRNFLIGSNKSFSVSLNYRTVFASDEELYAAKDLIEKYKLKQEPAGTSKEQIIYAKKLYESSFHPDNGDLQNVFGRMSFQVPGGMIITGAMLTFYKTTGAIVLWQFINQVRSSDIKITLNLKKLLF